MTAETGAPSEADAQNSETVEVSEFNTALLAPQDRFSFWQESIGVMFDVSLAGASDAAHFNARMDSLLLGDIVLSRSTSNAQSFHRGLKRILQDSLDHYMFQVFDYGHVDMELRTETRRAERGLIIAGDLAEPLTSSNSDYSLISVFIPRPLLDPHLRNSGMIHGAVIPANTGAGQLLANYMRTLERVGRSMSHSAASAASEALIILVAAAFNDEQVHAAHPPQWADHALLLQAQVIISNSLGLTDLSADIIASHLGVSRSRLYRLFQSYGGVMHIVREQRLRRALRDLVSRNGQTFRISEIAYRRGFTSPAQFARAFKNRYGCTPREARAEGRRFATQRSADTGINFGDRKYEAWIETLA